MPSGPLALALLLSGCGAEPSDKTAGGVTPDEARALDEAADMVEARRLPAEALRAPVAAATGMASPQAPQGQTGEPKQ